MERRLLNRNQGRVDDNIETIRKWFKVFTESSLPVIEYYSSKGMVRKIDAGKPVEEVFEAVKSVFSSAIKNVRHLLAVQCCNHYLCDKCKREKEIHMDAVCDNQLHNLC
ncbi:UMP-CMP kinase 4-like [Magnolia sinica]|uniref:UMP-CMP kinase 4-like n=1 Tax=Magnolia sinica TaxID=86752 RepID=UPI002657D175|nr:UMP-CMP kinase 4-like [Magnolia sinica]